MAYFDQYSEQYRQMLAASTGTSVEAAGFFAGRKIYQLQRMLPADFEAQTILDYGCGIGMSLLPLRQGFPNARIVGVDPSEASLGIAEDQHKALNIELLPLAKFQQDECRETFDLIFLSCVLHHIDGNQHQQVLQSLHERSSPSGRIAIVEHNPYNPLTRKTVRDCPFDEGVTLIPSHQLRRLLVAAHWHKPCRRYITFVPPSLQRLRGIEDWLPWCPAGGQYLLMAQRT